MQGIVAGKRSRGKVRQKLEKDITDIFGTMTTASRKKEDSQQFRKDIWTATSGSEEGILAEENNVYFVFQVLSPSRMSSA